MINIILSRMTINDAVDHAIARGVVLGNLRLSNYKEVLAEADDQYLPKIIRWYAEDMRLLLYSQKEDQK